MKRQQPIYLVLANIRSAYNVGSIFRTADAAGVTKIYLCGITSTPKNPKVLKTALGAEQSIPWEYVQQAGRLLSRLRKTAYIVALEQTSQSVDYRKIKLPARKSLVLIVGNEVIGITKSLFKYANTIAEIPMYGKKESLNVAVATGIMLYELKK